MDNQSKMFTMYKYGRFLFYTQIIIHVVMSISLWYGEASSFNTKGNEVGVTLFDTFFTLQPFHQKRTKKKKKKCRFLFYTQIIIHVVMSISLWYGEANSFNTKGNAVGVTLFDTFLLCNLFIKKRTKKKKKKV